MPGPERGTNLPAPAPDRLGSDPNRRVGDRGGRGPPEGHHLASIVVTPAQGREPDPTPRPPRSFVFRFVQCVIGLILFGVGIALIFACHGPIIIY